jgi:exonuclease SbcC
VRPLRLELRGFTAFRDPVEVDFSGLDVFAISGQTGSGKSSLLDAMTYALYGRVERVGDRVSQLISQGQPRMAVTLEFEVGRERYRVTRSTPSRGATRILLERADPDGAWGQAGEGADRVRDAERMMLERIGLSYDGFTRSVLLPQGRFQEFLVGDPRKRRDILTELLGLAVFRRMAERAGAIARESSIRAQTMQDLLEREFADATPEALTEAKRAAKTAAAAERTLAKTAKELGALAARWDRERAAGDELTALLDEVGRRRVEVEEAARELAVLGERAKASGAGLRAAVAAARATADLEAKALKAREEAEAAWGPLVALVQARTRAEGLAGLQRAAQAARDRLASVRSAAPGLAVALEKARSALAAAREGAEGAEAAAAEREHALLQAQTDDHVAALLAGAHAGDPCPVCGTPLARVPRRTAAAALARSRAALEKSRAAVAAAREEVVVRERAAEGAARELEASLFEEQRLTEDVSARDADVAALVAELQGSLGDPLPLEPGRELAARADRMEALLLAERSAAERCREAEQAQSRAEHERDRVAAAAAQARTRVEFDLAPMVARARSSAGGGFAAPSLPRLARAADPAAVAVHGNEVAAALGVLAAALAGAAKARRSAAEELVASARGLLPEGLADDASPEELAEAASGAARDATAEAAAAGQRAKDLAGRIERSRELELDATEAKVRAARFHALALELRADHLIAYLQAEALQALAAEGSRRLASLSDGRYRLACREDEFFVVDTWNGDDERSVRTLSGGETFLASLALALALADQVRAISVTDRAGLDSLFLDEGFGTLDPESLRTVIDAIEQLGGDGRLVGVITHVRELAEQFPRIEVEKSPRGSRVAFVA